MRRAWMLGILAACGGGAGEQTVDSGTPAIDAKVAPPDAEVPACEQVSGTPALAAEEVASGLTLPIVITTPPGDSRFFVAEKGGRVRIIGSNGQPLARAFLDLTSKVSKGNEQGLLGMAFHPKYAENGRFFVSFTDTAGDTRLWEYHVSATDHDLAGTQEKEILFQDQPASNHNGGQILFGPDGKLYLGLGDGGGQYDPSGNGQNLGTLLAKILRLDVDVPADEKYRVPPDNPFVGREGAKGEIWAFGLRNPWRWSWDRATGDLWIGDVGQDRYEEVDIMPAGQKGLGFGWGAVEGLNHCPRVPADTCTIDGNVLPIYEYNHDFGNAIVGGYVYRGCRMPDLRGTYFFADNGRGTVGSFRYAGKLLTMDDVTMHPGLAKSGIGTFAEDPKGEILYCALGVGRCFRIVPAP